MSMVPPLRRVAAALLALAVAALVLPLGVGVAAAQDAPDAPDEAPHVRLARPTWDTGWFQAEVYRLLLEQIGRAH